MLLKPASVAYRSSVERRITVVAIRPEEAEWTFRGHVAPVFVVFACASPPERHDADRVVFDAMLARVDFGP